MGEKIAQPTDGIYIPEKACIITPMDLRNLTNAEFVALCRATWYECNLTFFAGKLRRCPYFKGVPSHKDGAWFQPTQGARDKITFNRNAPCNETVELWTATLVHEMVHQEQWQHKSAWIRREHHGRFFRRRALEILPLLGYDIVSMYPKRKIR